MINAVTLVEPLWNIALLVKVFWPNLGDVHVNQVGIMTVDLQQLFLVVTVNINWMKVRNVLMGKDILRFSVRVTWSIKVVKFQVLLLLLLINTEVEVLV